jgi:DNA mismatch repair protein MutS
MTEAKKKQFTELKDKHPDALLLFRCGDFYESYQEDAESVSHILGITLTKDKAGDHQTMFPHYALDTYLPRLIRAGHRLAICDELKQGRAAQ